MLNLLLLSVALTPSDVAFEARAPIYCPENEARYTMLLPTRGAVDVPTNTSVWLAENVAFAPDEIELVDAANSTVAFDLEVIAAAPLNLVRLTPRALLNQNAEYTLRITGRADFEAERKFRTGAARDDSAPAPPSPTNTFSGSNGCSGWGLFAAAVTAQFPSLLLAESPDTGDLLGFDEFDMVHIPAAENSMISYRLVRVDLAGNRSEASSPREATVDEIDDGMGGCRCVPGARASLAWGLPLAMFGLLFVRRRVSAAR